LSPSDYEPVPGVLLRALGAEWAVYSPLAGSSHVLNDTGAAVLEVLAEQGPSPAEQVAAVIARDVELPVQQILDSLQPLWGELVTAGLVRAYPSAANT
jgi:PqqD family protein of HPr-rel-A system